MIDHAATIDSAALALAPTTIDRDLETEIADSLMAGCAEELAAIHLDNVTPECRARILATLDAIKGYRR